MLKQTEILLAHKYHTYMEPYPTSIEFKIPELRLTCYRSDGSKTTIVSVKKQLFESVKKNIHIRGDVI